MEGKKEVAALKYDQNESNAPKLVAKGTGVIAEKIIEKANEYKIPIVKNPELVKTLNNLRIGDEIPSELYEIVANILIFIGDIDNKYVKK